jgi:hypothetical protein
VRKGLRSKPPRVNWDLQTRGSILRIIGYPPPHLSALRANGWSAESDAFAPVSSTNRAERIQPNRRRPSRIKPRCFPTCIACDDWFSRAENRSLFRNHASVRLCHARRRRATLSTKCPSADCRRPAGPNRAEASSSAARRLRRTGPSGRHAAGATLPESPQRASLDPYTFVH